MSSLDQYIDIFEQNRRTIDSGSAELFARLRDDALKALKRSGRFPTKRDEGYEKISLEDMFAPDFGINLARVPFAVDVTQSFRCDVPNVSTLLGVVVNDEFRPTATLLKNCPQGLTVMSLARAASERPELVGQYLGRVAGDGDDVPTNLNTLLMQDGVFVHVAAGTKVDKVVQIVNIFNADASLLALRRVLVVVEDGASLCLLLCDHTQNPDHDYLSDQVVEIALGRGAHLDYCDMEESSDRTSRISQVYVKQQEGSELTVNAMSLTVGRTRNEFRIELDGENCSAEIAGMAIADGSQVIDNSTVILHHVPRCRSNQLFKYLLDGEAQGAFGGLIRVDQGADHTQAYQSNRNMLASTDARMHTTPQLEIYCDDVKCSHGATTGQLDQSALFYMRTRGITVDEARMMLMQAFMSDVIDLVAIDGLRDRLRLLVERRLSGERASCRDCGASCRD